MGVAPDDLAMVHAAVAGDLAALKLLLLSGHARLCTYLDRRIPPNLRGMLAPDDVAHEAYIQVFQHISTFRPAGPDALARWTSTIALRKLRNAVKAQRTLKRGGGQPAIMGLGHEDSLTGLLDLVAAGGPTPSRVLARDDAVQALRVALQDLPDHYRQAVRLVYLEGRPVAEAAATMGKTERAVHGLCRSALRLLRDHLGSASQFFSSSE